MAKKAPDPHCCIFHMDTYAMRAFKVRDTTSNNWFQYGLCVTCCRKLKNPIFQKDVSDRLEEILNMTEKRKQEEKDEQRSRR